MLDQIKINNIKRLMLCVMAKRQVTKAEIAETTELSTSTVSSCVNSLLKLKLLVNNGMEDSSGGRRSALYSLNGDYGCFIGLDLQPEGIYGAVVNCNAKVLKRFSHPLKGDVIPINAIIAVLGEEIAQNPKILGIGIGLGIAAKLDYEEQVVVSAPDFAWQYVHLKEIIERKYMIFTCVDHHANAAAICESMIGNGRGKKNYLYVGESFGKMAALVLDGRLCRGEQSGTGEMSEEGITEVLQPGVMEFLGISHLIISYRTNAFKDRIHECVRQFSGEIITTQQTKDTYPLGLAVTAQREWFESIYFML